jgi:hypothetical protein
LGEALGAASMAFGSDFREVPSGSALTFGLLFDFDFDAFEAEW